MKEFILDKTTADTLNTIFSASAGVLIGIVGSMVSTQFTSSSKSAEQGGVIEGNSQMKAIDTDDGIILRTDYPMSVINSNEVTFDEAFEMAREEHGAGAFFIHNGIVHTTFYKSEWEQMSNDSQQAFAQDIAHSRIEINELSFIEVDTEGCVYAPPEFYFADYLIDSETEISIDDNELIISDIDIMPNVYAPPEYYDPNYLIDQETEISIFDNDRIIADIDTMETVYAPPEFIDYDLPNDNLDPDFC